MILGPPIEPGVIGPRGSSRLHAHLVDGSLGDVGCNGGLPAVDVLLDGVQPGHLESLRDGGPPPLSRSIPLGHQTTDPSGHLIMELLQHQEHPWCDNPGFTAVK